MPLICGQTSVVLYPLREDTERPPPAHREEGTETGANRRSSDAP